MMGELQKVIADNLQYMLDIVRSGRYGNLEDANDQAAFEEDLNEFVLDKFED